MRYARRLPRALFIPVILALLSLAPIASAQQARGTLRGLVTDELGAAIVGANVTLTDATGAQKKVTTNAEGVYTFAGLAPGSYKLQAVAPGFTLSEEQAIEIKGVGFAGVKGFMGGVSGRWIIARPTGALRAGFQFSL